MPGPGFASNNLVTSGARDIAFSANQSRVYIALANGTVSVVNLTTRAVEATWNVGTSLGAIALSDDGANLLVLERSPPSDTAVVYRVSTETGTVTTFSRGGTNFLDLATMANNRVVLTGAGSNYLTMDIATGTFGSMAGGVFSSTTSVTAESGDLIVFSEAGSNGRLSLLNGGTQQFVATGSSSQFGNGLIAVSSNAQLVAQFRNFESVDIFDANLQLVRSINVGGQIDAIAFSASGRQLFVHNLNGEILRVDPATGAVLDVYATGQGVFVAGTALTGSEMIVTANDNHIVLRNHDTGAVNVYDFSVRTADEAIAAIAGANAMAAGAGDDTYFVDNAGDTVSEFASAGYDLINASVNFSLAAGSYVDVLASANPGGTQGLTLNGNELANRIIGDAGANALDGREGNDQLEGLGGNDILRGGAGNDYLIGGAGDDWFNGGADTDVFDGGSGSDTVSFSSSALGLIVNLDVAGGVVTLDNREILISIENIEGSDHADSLTGSSGNNRLDGGFGNDVIDGRGGLDLLYGNEGDDTIILRSPLLAGSVIDGGGWNDTLQVQLSAANGSLSGYGDAVSLLDVTVSGIETLAFQGFNYEFVNVAMTFAQASAIGSYVGGGSVDRVFIVAPAEGGDFTLPALTLSNFAPPALHSNHDSVVLTAQGQNADYTLRAGNNSSVQALIGGNGNDTLIGGSGWDDLTGGPGNDVLYAGGGQYNWLTGGAGDDTFFGGSGMDQFNGEAGRDTVSFATQDAGVFVEMVSPGFGFGGDAFYSIEVVVGSNFDDTILGLSTAEEMWGGYGADSFQGRDGNDSLYGGWGNDRLEGGGGNDSLFGNEGDDTLIGGAGADLFDGGAGFDTASFASSAVGIILDSNSSFGGAGEAQGDTFVSIESFAGSNFDDVMSGTAVSDSFVGNQGHDFLRGWGGADALYGSDGYDNLEGGSGADTLDGGAGIDVTSYGTASAGLRVSLANAAVNSGDAAGDVLINIEGLSGSWFGDDLIGDGASNQMWGSGGEDVLWGQGGNDELFGNDGNDWLIGGLGADKMDGGSGADTVRYSFAAAGLRADLQDTALNSGDAALDTYFGIENIVGSDYDDYLLGDGGNNEVWGDYGADHIWGRGGNDVLAGGNGLDTFHFNAGWGADRILDFGIGGAEKLSFDGIAGLTSFGQLTLTSGTGGLTVSFAGNSVLLEGVASITAADVTFA